MTHLAPSPYSMRILGSFAVSRDGQRIGLTHSAQRLPVLLAVGGELGREEAAGMLWPERPSPRANANLRTVLWRLRKEAPDLVAEEAGILFLDQNVDVDLHRLLNWARQAVRGDNPTPALVPPETPGGLLPSWDETWIDEPRRELRLFCQYALEAVAHRMLVSGRLGEAATAAASAGRLDPLREAPVRIMLEVHARENDHTAALRRFHDFRRHLLSETGTEPSAALAGLLRVSPRPVPSEGYAWRGDPRERRRRSPGR